MAKLLGIREVVGGVGLLARDVQGVGFYEAAGTVERQFSPFDAHSMGSQEAYDLSAPGRVAEIKSVLIALGQYYSDPNRMPSDPQIEDTFKYINTEPQFLDAWDGPTADAFALTVGRHRHRFPALMPTSRQTPLIQLDVFQNQQGTDVIVGGPQPTVAGLEALAQAAHEVLGDTVQLEQYLAWRGGGLDCASADVTDCTPPDSLVATTRNKGPNWNPLGWTVPWLDGPVAQSNPQLVDQLALTDKALSFTWQQAPQQNDEASRAEVAAKLGQLRQQRHEIVKQLNAGAPEPTCEDPSKVYDKSKGACVPRCTSDKRWDPLVGACVIDLPTVEIPTTSQASLGAAAAVIAMVAGGAWLVSKRGKMPDFGGRRG